MEYYDILFVIALAALSVFLWKMADHCDRVKSAKWKLLWLTPAFVAFFFMLLNGYDICLLCAYAAVGVLLLGFFSENKRFRQRLSIAAAGLAVLTVPLCLFSDVYRRADYTADFEEMFSEAKKRYVMTKHKNIDWDKLYAEYLPKFKEVTKNRDEVGNCILWESFCAEFHDGHVNFAAKESVIDEADERSLGNDYGLVTMKLSDGRFVALNVDDSLKSYGIHQLTEITSWDGMTVEEAHEKSEYPFKHAYADIDNEEFYLGTCAAGVGGDTVKVGFIADDGSEKTVELPKLDSTYSKRLKETVDKVNRSYPAANLTFSVADDDTVCLRMCAMSYDADSDSSEDYGLMKGKLKRDFLELKESGARDLIIDIRGNNGGSGGIVQAIAELFAPEGEHFYANNPKWDVMEKRYIKDENDDYIIDCATTFKGEDILDGGKIIILVNNKSVSAADHLTKVMSQFDNVTVMGFTEPNGSAQGVSAIGGNYGALYLSSSAILDEDGGIFVDSGADRQSSQSLDIKVPFDEEAVHSLFDEDEDYLFELALKELKK